MNKKGSLNISNKPFVITFFLSIIILVGVALRLYGLNAHDLWYDEVICRNVAVYSAYTNPAVVRPPLYFFLLKIWLNLFGDNEFTLRFFALIFGIISICIIYKFGRLLFNQKVGLLAAFLLSISPFHIWYSQEVKEYVFLTFLVLLTSYFYFQAIIKEKFQFWILFILFSSLAIYTNCIVLFFIPATIVYSLTRKNKLLLRRVIIAWLIVLSLFFFPFGWSFFRRISWIMNTFWIPKPSFRSLLFTFENFNLGYTGTRSLYLVSDIFFFTLFSLGLFLNRNKNIQKIFLLFMLFIPISLIFLFSQYKPIYIDRQLLIFSPFYYLIVSSGLIAIKNKTVKLIVLLFLIFPISLSLCNYFSDYMPSEDMHHLGSFIKRPFKPAVKFIEKYFKEGDLIAHTNFGTLPPFRYYQSHKFDVEHSFFYIPNVQDKYWHIISKYISEDIDITGEINRLPSYKRIWLVLSSWPREYSLDRDSIAIKEWVGNNYNLLYGRWFDGILIELYEQI